MGDVFRALKRDRRTMKNALRIAMDTFQVQLCGDCRKIGHETLCGKVSPFSICRFPVMFFTISNLGMRAVAGRPLKTFNRQCTTYKIRINASNITKRLIQAFIFGVCLLTIVRAPTAMSAPASRNGRDEADEPAPKWKYPCGWNHEVAMDNDSGPFSSVESDRDIIRPVITIAEMARDHLNGFKEKYVTKTFGAPYEEHHRTFKENVYEWLPSKKTDIPKSLGESVKISHLETLRLDKFLTDIYESMQKYAVGIEQIVWDQERTNGDFRKQFNETEVNLRKVLCELRTAMINRNVRPLNNVDRSLMDDLVRNMSDTADINLRDWIIFREYMNGLEYLIQVLIYIEANPPS